MPPTPIKIFRARHQMPAFDEFLLSHPTNFPRKGGKNNLRNGEDDFQWIETQK
jgi:hypothetical protein